MKTGFKDLDNIIKLNGGELIVVASRPAMGKSTFVQNIMSNVVIKQNKATLLFSLEESKEKIINRLIASNSVGVNLLKNAPIYIASDIPYTIDEICLKSKDLKIKKDIKLIIIDYLQLIAFDKKELLSRDNEIKEILRRLKILAKELDVPIIITTQLSKQLEKREDKRPCIADFTNSKNGILTYSDKILFLYSDSYYYEGASSITEILIAKNNDGPIDIIKL